MIHDTHLSVSSDYVQAYKVPADWKHNHRFVANVRLQIQLILILQVYDCHALWNLTPAEGYAKISPSQ